VERRKECDRDIIAWLYMLGVSSRGCLSQSSGQNGDVWSAVDLPCPAATQTLKLDGKSVAVLL